jgi:hypothetical protein
LEAPTLLLRGVSACLTRLGVGHASNTGTTNVRGCQQCLKKTKKITDTAWTKVGHGSDTLETRTELESPKKTKLIFKQKNIKNSNLRIKRSIGISLFAVIIFSLAVISKLKHHRNFSVC